MQLTESPDFDVRFSATTDEPYLREWLHSPGTLHWFPCEVGMELENFVRVLIGFARYNAALTAIYKGRPIGMVVLFLMPYKKVAHHCLCQIVVAPEFRMKGVGRTLMRNAMHLAKDRFKLEMMHIEVLDENPFIPMLETLGFMHVARQEHYVKEHGNYFPRFIMEVQL